MNEKVKYWLDLAEYDLETAHAMFDTKRWLYVGFMCHQVTEKMLKAYFTYTQNSFPPYIHNLSKLAMQAGLDSEFSEQQKDLLEELEPLNIETRYPSYREQLLKSLSPQRCERLIDNTSELKIWIREKLEK